MSDHPPPRPEHPSHEGTPTPGTSTTPEQGGGSGRSHDTSIGTADRVFPIRSLVSLDPSARNDVSHATNPTLSPTGGARHYSIIDDQTWTRMRSESESRTNSIDLSGGTRPTPQTSEPASSQRMSESSTRPRSNTLGSRKGDDNTVFTPTSQDEPDQEAYELMTSRFRHIVTDDGHAVITGRTVDSFKACEDEPIHIPGAIQSFGALVAVCEEPNEQMVVRVVSENSKDILGYSPNDLFSLSTFCDILSDDETDTFLDHVDFVRDEGYDPAVDGPEVFILTVNTPDGSTVRLWCAMHNSPTTNGLVVCEFELEDDHASPLTVSGQISPAAPANTLDVKPTMEQMTGSTTTINQPLRVLRRARRRKGEAAAMEVFGIVSQIQEQLARADSMDTLLDTTAGIVKELTGFHRILVYEFDSEFNGKVVAELVDPTMSIDLFKGLHFPAGDIPKQARDLYRINKVRLLYDRDHVTARLVCRTLEDLETPLDMTHSYLRAMSPIHIKYLANMEVRSSMSISVNGPNDLWGLISCHSYGSRGMRVSFPIRKMCRLIGDTVSRNIERLSYASRLQARKLINTVPTDANPSGYIVASSDDLLRLVDADYGALCIRGEIKILAKSHQSQEMLALLEYLRVRKHNSVLTSSHIVKDFQDLHYPPGFKNISGLLYVPLSTDGQDFIAFFRRGQLTEVKWGGNPNLAKFSEGHLEPRKSFQTWSETVLDRCRDWTESEVDTAAVLCLVYGKFIKVWRQQEAALESSSLTKLLLANSAHEVRTPLNAIVNYLEIALEGALDGETRDHLSKSHSASKSLIYVINDLLDLTNVEKGQNLIKDEPFDLPATLKEATAMFESETNRKSLKYTVIQHPGIPDTVVGDQRRVRQSISNLVSNAIQHTTEGSVTVEMWHAPGEGDPDKPTVKIAVLDTGDGISPATLERLFRELEQVTGEDDSENRGDNGENTSLEGAAPQEKTVLGLGLALVARIVRNMHGQLTVRSEEGKGSRFQISLQLPVPDGSETPSPGLASGPVATKDSVAAFPTQGDMVLVDNTSASKRNSPPGTGSEDSTPKAEQNTPRGTAQPLDQVEKQLRDSAEAASHQLGSAAKPTSKPYESESPLRVLVAEDDPINAKILQKRLGKLGYTVKWTMNGEECANAYAQDPTQWDVVLMDIQMPILDGMDSTKRIREFEKQHVSPNLHVPVFAVSASLLEKDAQMYIDLGFDGWIMKPINFERLNTLLAGLHQEHARNGAVYKPGQWEKGGWFTRYTS
ncbi:putative sensor histidine kinase/response regulator [Aspergillus puulaauensis]|uniref:Light-sensor protein kinase n=1 Tax=Aspergillus puulaauensis TaxID=1220207 RepID=A0A7R8ALL6_9EURO|nr:light-sensor protein kinase [Aspergillus puulaauensis]BCS21668.1 light-sensor protein kinase [Aspergillus puulaauensis]